MHCRAASPEHTCHHAACTSDLGRAAWGRHPPWAGAQSWGQRCTLSTVARPPPASAVHLRRYATVCCSLLLRSRICLLCTTPELTSVDTNGAKPRRVRQIHMKWWGTVEIVLTVAVMHAGCACIKVCLHRSACLELVNLHEDTC